VLIIHILNNGKGHHSQSTHLGFGGHLMVQQVGDNFLKFRKKYFRGARVGEGVNGFITNGFYCGL